MVNRIITYYYLATHFANLVDSNDTLYAQEPEFLKEIHTYCEIIFQELLDSFKKSPSEDLKRQCNNALEIVNLILNIGNAQSMAHIIQQLWAWISKNHARLADKDFDRKMKITLESIKRHLQVNEKKNEP